MDGPPGRPPATHREPCAPQTTPDRPDRPAHPDDEGVVRHRTSRRDWMETTTAPPAQRGFHALTRRQLVGTIIGLQVTLLLAALDGTIVGTAMPQIIAQLSGFDRYAWVTTSFMLTSTIGVPIFGKLSDIYGRKWILLGGAALSVIASAPCGAAGDLPRSEERRVGQERRSRRSPHH